MKMFLKPCLGMLVVALGMTGCVTPPFDRPQTIKPAPKARVIDRSARRPAYQRQPGAEQLPQNDALLPRESASSYPSRTDPYAASGSPNPYGPPSERPYSAYPIDRYQRPYSPPASEPSYPTYSDLDQKPSAGRFANDAYQAPAYPPGAATPDPTEPAHPPSAGSLPEPQAAVVPSTPPRRPPPPAAEPTPPPPPAPEPSAVAPTNSTVAANPPSTPAPEPVASVAPPPQPSQPAPAASSSANLPAAEISRDGNQAVVALLESADKYVKSNQLDKAGAALERALRIEPRNAGIWHDLAQVRLHQGQYQQAESLASKSNNLAGENRALQARNWKLIGSARKASGNRAGAEEAEARASQLSH